MSIRRLSLGAGYRYLMESIAVGDGRPEQSSSLTRYYAESGTPPGVFLGAGLAHLGDGAGIQAGSEVTEEHLYRMLGECADPLTGEPLGRRPNDKSPGGKAAIAGFDLTFSPSKSVSTLWALADQGTQAVIYDCHRQAVAYVLAYAEEHVFHARSGTNGIVQEDLDGVIATAFTHYDSRAGDPQLHDHLVVWNRARTTSGARWRTLDSRGLFKHAVALSELHQGVLSDLLTEMLGVGWDSRARRHSTTPRWEITGVPEALLAEFSTRAEQIETRRAELLAEFHATRGRPPSQSEILRLRQRATLDTRPDKTHGSLAELTERWRDRASGHLDAPAAAWVQTLVNRSDLPVLRASDFAEQMLADAAQVAAANVAERRSTFSRANLLAEVHRLFHGVRFAGPDDRVAVAETATDLATSESVLLTAPERHSTPEAFRRADGSSKFRARGHEVYTSQALLDAEARLLNAARRTDGPTVDLATVAQLTEDPLPGRSYPLSVDQALAVEKITRSGRPLDVLVGPAGTGKSTTMAGLKALWEADHGPGSVTGLAPSAAAAEVLAAELGMPCENTAKWLSEHRRRTERLAERRRLVSALASPSLPARLSRPGANRIAHLDRELATWGIRPGQLVIVDEASLVGTFALDELVDAAARAGGKVLLAGDWAQLSAIEAGGAFRMLVDDRDGQAPELNDVRRFEAGWEKAASVQLRVGNTDSIDAYVTHGRVIGGRRDDLLDAIFDAWKVDVDAGQRSLMIAPDSASVAELNQRARADRVAAGLVSHDGLEVAGGMIAGVGDEIVTRQNDRRLATGTRWVKNGDRWTVTATNDDGNMTVKRANGGGEVVLPTAYVHAHVEIAYATTTHRAQGRTVDTAHALISATTTREALYVGATRGRDGNHLYIDTHYDPDPATGHPELTEPATAADVLAAVLAKEGGDLSAHDTRRRSLVDASSITTLAAEYQTIARGLPNDRWIRPVKADELTSTRFSEVETSSAWDARRATEVGGIDAEGAPSCPVTDQRDQASPASALRVGVERWSKEANRKTASDFIAGLFPRAPHAPDPEVARALEQRERAIEARALELARRAVRTNQMWTTPLGVPSSSPSAKRIWWRSAATIAAYRERWNIHDGTPLGDAFSVTSIEMLGQRKRALLALHRAAAAQEDRASHGLTPSELGLHNTDPTPQP